MSDTKETEWKVGINVLGEFSVCEGDDRLVAEGLSKSEAHRIAASRRMLAALKEVQNHVRPGYLKDRGCMEIVYNAIKAGEGTV